MQGYNFEIKHKSGSQNRTADFLSRQRYTVNSAPAESNDLADHIFSLETRLYTQTTLVYPGDDDAELMVVETATKQAQDLPDEDRELFIGLAIYQQECPDFKHIFQYLTHRQVPEDPQLARTVVAESYNYELEDGILKHFYSKRGRHVHLEEHW